VIPCRHPTARALAPGNRCPLCPPWTLREGEYQTALADVAEIDCVIADPPYGARTHDGHENTQPVDGAERRALSYKSWTRDDVGAFVQAWAPRCRGWMAVMSCSDLAPAWRETMEDAGRCAFAPVPCVIRGMTVRLQGDGPSSWSVYLNVSRPRSREFVGGWTRPGAYVVGRGSGGHIGGKPLDLMKLIVGDYSRPGDLVCDPCAGYATTGVAALQLGRRFVGSEVAPATHAEAAARLAAIDLSVIEEGRLEDPGADAAREARRQAARKKRAQ
jgi:hypothetical protein